ncbi:choice-of-anchor H family protein [Ketobacter alkanivorans]|uniref:Uncharacterized protein n=1 Tax=Ketobacter alkanivorans TaxID=1917421 RepID=A0A2K9LMM2_9GAMM|nr:choice-of-anchor H family protein [Ketobacter alkanivorans]AUM13542.1 hypothetical protein Kalk_14410 [Ketobacter alkanivorans]
MYKIPFTVVTLLLLILANHPQAHAAAADTAITATPNTATGSKTKGQLVNNPSKTESTLNTRALSYQDASHSAHGSVSLYDIWFDMKSDIDGDGYYHQFDVSFDLDTHYNSQTIYVIAELNGLTTQTLFQTTPYTLYGNSGNDSYQANVLLTDGYPPHQYNLTLRVFDANSDELLLTYNTRDHNDANTLNLEDSQYESVSNHRLSLYELSYELRADYDSDGYYTELTVDFDADAPGAEQWIYARISLIDSYGQQHEISLSNDFMLYDYASNDAYSTQINLNHGFEPDTYQLIVELYDADTHALLLTSTTPPSARLRLESSDRDASYGVTVEEEYYVAGSGGGAGMLLLTTLMILLILKRRYKSEK